MAQESQRLSFYGANGRSGFFCLEQLIYALHPAQFRYCPERPAKSACLSADIRQILKKTSKSAGQSPPNVENPQNRQIQLHFRLLHVIC